jgi:NADH dehydrogenase FAD-containing subunit
VKVPEDGIKQQKQTMPLAKRDPKDKRNYVIIGGGAAGLNCAETLRQSGFTGKITLVSAEKKLPYDRTLLTKTLPFGDATKFVLRDQAFLDGADIDVINDSVYAIHTDKKKVTFGRA